MFPSNNRNKFLMQLLNDVLNYLCCGCCASGDNGIDAEVSSSEIVSSTLDQNRNRNYNGERSHSINIDQVLSQNTTEPSDHDLIFEANLQTSGTNTFGQTDAVTTHKSLKQKNIFDLINQTEITRQTIPEIVAQNNSNVTNTVASNSGNKNVVFRDTNIFLSETLPSTLDRNRDSNNIDLVLTHNAREPSSHNLTFEPNFPIFSNETFSQIDAATSYKNLEKKINQTEVTRQTVLSEIVAQKTGNVTNYAISDTCNEDGLGLDTKVFSSDILSSTLDQNRNSNDKEKSIRLDLESQDATKPSIHGLNFAANLQTSGTNTFGQTHAVTTHESLRQKNIFEIINETDITRQVISETLAQKNASFNSLKNREAFNFKLIDRLQNKVFERKDDTSRSDNVYYTNQDNFLTDLSSNQIILEDQETTIIELENQILNDNKYEDYETWRWNFENERSVFKHDNAHSCVTQSANKNVLLSLDPTRNIVGQKQKIEQNRRKQNSKTEQNSVYNNFVDYELWNKKFETRNNIDQIVDENNSLKVNCLTETISTTELQPKLLYSKTVLQNNSSLNKKKQQKPKLKQRSQTKKSNFEKSKIRSSFLKHKSANDHTNSINNKDGILLRQEAEKYFKNFKMLKNKAKIANKLNDKLLASSYNAEAKKEKQRFEQANATAAAIFLEENLKQNSNINAIDLHHLYVKEAIEALDIFLDSQINILQTQKLESNSVIVITGRGKHSKKGIPKVKPAIIQRLSQRKLRCFELNPGCLKVRISNTTVLSNEL